MKPICDFVTRLLLGCALAGAVGAPALAAPFCVQYQQNTVPTQCIYTDPNSCQAEATRVGGRCAANPSEYLTPAGGQPFCVIQSGNVPDCIYTDRASCDEASRKIHAACVAAVPAAPPPHATDPFELKRPY
jgi:hypothetical protein